MSIYSQIQKNLLFHWTAPKSQRAKNAKTVKSLRTLKKSDRLEYLDRLVSVLGGGLQFRKPQERHHEWIEKGVIQLRHPMVSFTEWSASGAAYHSEHYGHMAVGFTRKFIIEAGGRPLVYLPHDKGDVFRKSLLTVLKWYKSAHPSTDTDAGALESAEVVESFLKLYSVPPAPAKKEAKTRRVKSPPKTQKEPDPDKALLIPFGGAKNALEDREWRVVGEGPLPCRTGGMMMVILPDHATLHHALASRQVRGLIDGLTPAVCMISKEMLSSI